MLLGSDGAGVTPLLLIQSELRNGRSILAVQFAPNFHAAGLLGCGILITRRIGRFSPAVKREGRQPENDERQTPT